MCGCHPTLGTQGNQVFNLSFRTITRPQHSEWPPAHVEAQQTLTADVSKSPGWDAEWKFASAFPSPTVLLCTVLGSRAAYKAFVTQYCHLIFFPDIVLPL